MIARCLMPFVTLATLACVTVAGGELAKDKHLFADGLKRALGLGEGELALLHADERFELVPERAFVAATRAAVRTTTAEATR